MTRFRSIGRQAVGEHFQHGWSAHSADSGGATATGDPDALALAAEVLTHIREWATLDREGKRFPWIAARTAAALEALEARQRADADMLATARALTAAIARHCRCGAIPSVLGHVAGCRVAALVELLGGGE